MRPKHGKILTQLEELRLGPERDDYGILRPANAAYETTIAIIREAANELDASKVPFLFGNVSTDENGGVRIEWTGHANVHVSVSCDGYGQLYYEFGDDYGMEELTVKNLVSRLKSMASTLVVKNET